MLLKPLRRPVQPPPQLQQPPARNKLPDRPREDSAREVQAQLLPRNKDNRRQSRQAMNPRPGAAEIPRVD